MPTLFENPRIFSLADAQRFKVQVIDSTAANWNNNNIIDVSSEADVLASLDANQI